ncbi:MAG: DNA translocase FtsK, partial [Patescibacteria group bacterium]
PIPGKSLVGIEVPNKAASIVRLGSLMGYPEFSNAGALGFALGRDVTGEPIFADIEKMPHMLVAGSTGSGKSVSIHSMLISLLYKNSPSNLKMILIDPKRVELTAYSGIPHLIAPVVTESKKSLGVFRWALKEMDSRYEILERSGSRDVKSYNKKNPNDPLPFIIIVIDELADLMSTYGREVEGSVVRLSQMARATGLHLILATQRPSVEVITGLIKANITTRVALQVASQVDSRTILDMGGAEKLLGGGDMLYISSDLSKPKRIQGAYVSEEEINKVIGFIRENNSGYTHEDVPVFENGSTSSPQGGFSDGLFDGFGEDDDELLEEAIRMVIEAQKASASLLQRRLKVGYARAARLLDIMESKGIIGPGEGAKPRDVYVKREP